MVNDLLSKLSQSEADTGRIHIFIELAKFHIYKPGEAKNDLDSGFSYLSKAQQLNETTKDVGCENAIETMRVIGSMERRDTINALRRFHQLLTRLEAHGYKEAEADLLLKMGIWLSTNEKNYPELLSYYDKALALCREISNEVKETQILLAISSIHLNEGKLDLTEKELKEIIRRQQAIRYPKLHYAYSLLSTVYRLKGEYKPSLQNALLCIQSMEQTEDTLSKPNFYADLGRLYMEIGDKQKGIEAYRKALDYWRNQGIPNFPMYNAAGFLITDWLEKGRLHDAFRLITGLAQEIPPLTKLQKGAVAQNLAYCYEAMQRYREAESYYLEAADWYTKTGNDFEVTQKLQFDVGRFYWKRQEFEASSIYLSNALAHSPQKNQLATIRDIHLMLSTIDSAKGDFMSALQHMRQYNLLNDSIMNVDKSRQIQELEVTYEMEKKESDIRLLQNETRAQTAKLREAYILRTFALIGSLLLLLILFLLIRQSRIKQQASVEIQRKNEALQGLVREKEWLVREIHHRVKNNLQIIISLFNTQSEFANHPSVVQAIKEGQERMQTIALLHQNLYGAEPGSTIAMNAYIPDLVNNLDRSFSNDNRVRFLLDIDPVELDISQALPVGLILNEAITNSLKYAFPNQKDCTIAVSLKTDNFGHLRLTIKDNGVGISSQNLKGQTQTLGMQLLRLFTEQLEGELTFKNKSGTEIYLDFIPHIYESQTKSSRPIDFA